MSLPANVGLFPGASFMEVSAGRHILWGFYMRIHIIKFLNRALEPGVIIHASNLNTLGLRRKTTSLKPAWSK